MKEKHLLSVVANEDGTQVVMHLDLAGVNYLLKELGHLKAQLEKNDCPHLHLFADEWGGGELTSTRLTEQEDEKQQARVGWADEGSPTS